MAVRRRFTQTKLFRALIVFLILWGVGLVLPKSVTAPVRTVVATVTFPIEKVFSVLAFEVRDFFGFFGSIGELKGENERLEKERVRLLAENAKFTDIMKENEELRRELELLPRENYRLKGVEVIGRDVSGLGNWLTVDQGSLQDVRVGMSVIAEGGVLVGEVAETFPGSARVRLLSNPESLVNGIAVDTEAKGIVKGEHGLGLLFDMVLQADTLKSGDQVVTSGLGGRMPQGLLIGTIQETGFSDDRLFQRAVVVSPIKSDRLRYVFIITEPLKQ